MSRKDGRRTVSLIVRVVGRAIVIWLIIVGTFFVAGIFIPGDLLGAISWYFYLPSLVFGSRFFEFGIGVGPAGAVGCGLTVLFYGLPCLVIAYAYTRLDERRNQGWYAGKDEEPSEEGV